MNAPTQRRSFAAIAAEGDHAAAFAAVPADHAPGANGPPEPTPFEAARDAVNDLANEAQNWLDGVGIKTQGEADMVGKLVVEIRAARKIADSRRIAENEPFDTGKAEVQARYNPILKRADLATDAAKKALTPWLKKAADEQAAAAQAARVEARRLAALAAEAMRTASATNLAEREAAEALVRDAKFAGRMATKAENATPAVGAAPGARSVGLRSTWKATMTDDGLALQHYLTTRLGDVNAFLQTLAERDTAAGKRTIPGFQIEETKVAA